jgi:excisionase family DNA binding protein
VTEPLLFPIRMAAHRAGIGRDAMYALVRAGRIRSITVGSKRLIPVAELHRWIERELGGGGDALTKSAGTEGPQPTSD